jgi:hypothetical protein
MHRLVTNAPKGKVVDHRNYNDQDNRKFNLRICTQKENKRNYSDNQNNKSGRKGVRWATELVTPKWHAYIWSDYKHIHLGYFDHFEDAVTARENAEKKYFGEYSWNESQKPIN